MVIDELNRLLEKYWEGETSLAEEHQLKEYFRTAAEVPEALRPAAAWFRQLGQEAQQEPQLAFMVPEAEQKVKPLRRSRTWYWAAAAVLAMALSLGIWQTQQTNTPMLAEAESFDDADEAYREARKALLLVSAHLNTGREDIQKLDRIHKLTQIISNTQEQ